ncbi:RloB family protein [Endozoicomonas sp. Mp262]|uniref:RloB family protein n=1 Tax=Endozoicomonas sp. Mp262 TaxID=2919499 RepID=UPI0021D8B24B
MPKPKKKQKKSPVKPVFKIYCEGEKTEPYYLRGYINEYHSGRRTLFVIPKTNKNTPVQLVDEAIDEKQKGNTGDIYWVVFDRESTTKYSHKLHTEARRKAKKNGIEIALSNVCFEFWLLLHFEKTTAAYNSYDDLIRKSNLKKYLKERGIENYDKALTILYNEVSKENGVQNAIINAEQVNKQISEAAQQGEEEPHFLNPYTDVYKLLSSMREFSKSN